MKTFELIVYTVTKNLLFSNVYQNMKKIILNLISVNRFGIGLRKMFDLFVCIVI